MASGTHPPYEELVADRRVHRSLYVDPAVFADEMDRLFGATWTYVAHESELAEADDFVTRTIGRRPVIVSRDRDGDLHVLINRCTHRAATVCRVDAGSARRFTCPYHGWIFANTGACQGVPLQRGYGPALDKSDLDLGAARVASYRGFVFATFNPDEAPLENRLGPAAGLLDQWIDRSPTGEVIVRHGANRLEYRGNWKLATDNSGDGYHPGYSHKSLLTMRHDRYGEGVDMQYVLDNVDAGGQYVQDLGNGHHFLDQRREIERYWPQAAPSPGREGYEAVLRDRLGVDADAALETAVGSGMNLNIFPNLLIIGNQIQVVEPLAVDHTRLHWYATSIGGVPDEITSLRMRLQEDFPSFGEPDDLANFEECQRGLAAPEMEWIRTDRHLDSDTERVEEGLLTGVASDELTLRAFWRRWRELMTSDVKLVAQ
jgi:phenylpropionate dioxygenase-like ring-hydroxylating dioxygenase large terminal subunit